MVAKTRQAGVRAVLRSVPPPMASAPRAPCRSMPMPAPMPVWRWACRWFWQRC
jgi:hypothetical protein